MRDLRTDTFGQFEMRAEMRRALREGKMPKPSETKRRVSDARLARTSRIVVGAAAAAWLLVVPVSRVYAAIAAGTLPAEREPREGRDGFRWRILRTDVERMARRLYGACCDLC